MFPEEDYGYDYGPDDEEPQNCSTAETIKGGHVTYSQVKITLRILSLKWEVPKGFLFLEYISNHHQTNIYQPFIKKCYSVTPASPH